MLTDAEPGRTLGAMAERVAVVETKVASLKDDTGVIRSSIHAINNELMKVHSAEIRCADALEALHGILAGRAIQVDRIAANVDTIMLAKSAAEGAWAATARYSAALVASSGLLMTMAGMILWLLGYGHIGAAR